MHRGPYRCQIRGTECLPRVIPGFDDRPEDERYQHGEYQYEYKKLTSVNPKR